MNKWGIIVFFFVVMQTSLHAQVSVKSIAQEYKSATTESEKMNLCIKAINHEFIAFCCPIKNVDQIFGTQFTSHLPEKGSTDTEVIDFAVQPKVISNTQATGHVGWYLVIKFDSNGIICNYNLSNVHKGT